MKRTIILMLATLLLAGSLVGPAMAADGEKLEWTGVNYTKFLWGNRRMDGSMYNFTTIPSEGYGDNGQATEFELLFHSKPSSKIEVNGRIKSRFNQNQWTNWGGFGGDPNVVGRGDNDGGNHGNGGEYDPRSNEYIKLRGITVNITPGYRWLNRATIGSSDFGMFDPLTIGKIRYIDRDNGKGLFFNGSFLDNKLSYDLARISLSRLWSGPNYSTGEYHSMDAAYGLKVSGRPTDSLDLTGIFEYVDDFEIDPNDDNPLNGTDLRNRQCNRVFGGKMDYSRDVEDFFDFHLDAAVYFADYYTINDLGLAGLTSYTAYPLGDLDDWTYLIDANFDDIGGSGLSLTSQYFDIGSDWVSVMAARREADVLLTEGHEGTWYYPEADNASWKGTSVLGYGGFLGHAQQVATTNVDNEFTDFDEPMAETVIGWKGFTMVPSWGWEDLELSGEFSFIDYNTNWQMWGDDAWSINNSPYVTSEPDAGFGSYRNAYMPFQEKETKIYVVKADYYLDLFDGIDLHGRFKYVDEQDLRINDESYLPANNADVANYYGAASVGTNQNWAAFDSLDDDDKQMDMYLTEIGAGYQVTDELHCDLTYQYYDVDLLDGNTAFQGNRSHRMAGGNHVKNNIILNSSYNVGGAEFGMVYQWSFGEWAPDFGDGFDARHHWSTDAQLADPGHTPDNNHGVPGFYDNWGMFQSLEKHEYTQGRMKAYMKLLF